MSILYKSIENVETINLVQNPIVGETVKVEGVGSILFIDINNFCQTIYTCEILNLKGDIIKQETIILKKHQLFCNDLPKGIFIMNIYRDAQLLSGHQIKIS